jgi:L-2,4-diaminobutyrate decarboxylase
MHVDGAHGASFALSTKHRSLVAGIERADSVVWDAHKMLLCPALVTAVLFKDGRDAFAAFHASDASYLFDAEGGRPKLDSGLRTLECTKSMMVLMPYVALAVHGEAHVARYLDDIVDLAHDFADRVANTPGLEVAVPPMCNIVCFRGPGDMDALRQRLLEAGDHYVVKTQLRGETWLRTTLINPRTTLGDLDRLIASLRA